MPTARFQTVCAVRLLTALLAVPLVLAACQGDEGGTGDATATPTTQAATTVPPTTLSERDQVIADLKQAIKVRDEAFENRDASLFDQIYADECPCLDRDRKFLMEMRDQRVVWKGLSSTVSPKKIEQVSSQRWTVIADVQFSGYEVLDDSGKVIRQDPPDQGRFLFAMVSSSESWRLADMRLLDG